ncbi:MAG: hypothetical protein ACXAC8_14530 [Candidatus Hodarchaeales archaeon]
MVGPEVLAKSHLPAKRFEEYQIVKSWGFMLILTGIFTTLFQTQFDIFFWVIRFLNLDPYQVSFSWMTPLSLLIWIGFPLSPIILVILSYLTTKRVVVEPDKISSWKFVLFGLTMCLMYLSNFFFSVILDSSIFNFIFFPSTIFMNSEGIPAFSTISLKAYAIILFTGGLTCLVSYLGMHKTVNYRRFRELLLSGVILLGFFLLITIHINSSLVPDITAGIPRYSYPSTPPFEALEQLFTWVTIIVFNGCYFGSGVYSIRKAYHIKEGKE